MRRHVVGIASLLFVLALVPVPARAQGSDTVRVDAQDAMRIALEVSPEVGAVASELAYAEARRSLARASRFATDFSIQTAHAVAPGLENVPDGVPTDEFYLYPDVRNDWENIRPFNRFETTLLQPLFTWGQISGSIDAADHGVDVERASVAQKQNEVALRSGEIYYGLLLAEQLSRLAEEAGEVVEQAKDEIQRLLDEGDETVDDADLFQVRITEQELARRVVEVDQRLLTVRSALRRQLMLPETFVVVPEERVLAPIEFVLDSLAAYEKLALIHRSELEQATAGTAAREAQVRVARSDYFPKLFLGIESRVTLTEGRFRQPNPYVNDPYRGRSLRAGLGLQLPLNFAQTRAKVEQAEAQHNEVRHQLTAARQLVLFEVEEAYRNVIAARSAMESQDAALAISQDWLRTEQINFDLDLGDTENLVDAVQTSFELEASYYEQVRKYNVTILTLLAKTGVLEEHARAGRLILPGE